MLPAHLKRYVVEQDYSRYTPIDQEVWRYIMRQLKSFLSQHAHPSYLEGLQKTGIETDRIPEISKMSSKLEKFGWQAVPVSGFIPPAAFMELQAHGYLPIASDMRAIDHLMYTPAPDIVHEAAGHAPILINDEFAAYLKAYAQVASKAIISREDMNQYEAIRVLSDLKEDPSSTPEQVAQAELRVISVTKSMSHLSEAAYLSRMNWWTAEYGLIGPLNDPKIYGAGLLSSVGEAHACLDPKVKKIPFSLDCINYSYDITEPQPQLFVTPDFHTLHEVLVQLSQQMAYNQGGLAGLKKIQLAETVNTVVLNSGLQISGCLKDYLLSEGSPAYLQFAGPCQLSLNGHQLDGHGPAHHSPGFGSPVGLLENATKCLSKMSATELAGIGIAPDTNTELKFKTGVRVSGHVKSILRSDALAPIVISFSDCTVSYAGKVLFEPAWGIFDMAIGSDIVSVFGGPADRLRYGEAETFAAKVIPRKQWPPEMIQKHSLYQELRDLRESPSLKRLEALHLKVNANCPNEWLLKLSLYEICHSQPEMNNLCLQARAELHELSRSSEHVRTQIEDGLRLLA